MRVNVGGCRQLALNAHDLSKVVRPEVMQELHVASNGNMVYIRLLREATRLDGSLVSAVPRSLAGAY